MPHLLQHDFQDAPHFRFVVHHQDLIAGASGGIGAAIARDLARRGASLVLVSREAVKAHALADELARAGNPVLPLVSDLAKPGNPERLVKEVLSRTAGVDVLINCAGVQNFGFFAQEEPTDTARLFSVNTLAPIALIHAVLPHMLERGQGQIVNVGSIFGSIGFPCFASYSASKFALRGFSEALRRELSGSGIGVTYVAPRFTKTPFNRGTVTRMAHDLKMNQDEPEAVAARVITAIEKNGRDIYLGWPESLFVRINALLPRLMDKPLMKQADQMRPYALDASR